MMHGQQNVKFSHGLYENTLRQIRRLRSQPVVKSDVFTCVCKYSVYLTHNTNKLIINMPLISRDHVSHYGWETQAILSQMRAARSQIQYTSELH
jgi:hypothetical protein